MLKKLFVALLVFVPVAALAQSTSSTVYTCAPVTLTVTTSGATTTVAESPCVVTGVVTPSPAPSPTPSPTPRPTATPSPSPSPTPIPTPKPTATPSPSPSPTPAPANLVLDPTFAQGVTGSGFWGYQYATGVEGCPTGSTACTWTVVGATLTAPGMGVATNYFIVSAVVPVLPGEVLQFGATIADASTGGTGASMTLVDAATGYTTTYASAKQSPGAAGAVAQTWTVPAGITGVRVQLLTSDTQIPVGKSDVFSAPYLYAVSGGPTPAPTASPSPAPGAGPVASLCIGGSLYTLGQYDNFAADSSLSVSDSWNPTGAMWSNQFPWGRTNNAGYDLALYPSQVQMSTLWPTLAPVAKLIPGVGLDLHSEPVPMPTTAAQHAALCDNQGGYDTTCRTYLSGMLGSSATNATGYWVAREQLAADNATGTDAWDSSWIFNTPGIGDANELDNPEQWQASILGANVVQQTIQCYSPCTSGAKIGYRGVLATSQTAMNDYGTIVTSAYNGFYINEQPTSVQLKPNSNGPLAWLLTAQVNGSYGVLPAAGWTGDFLIQYVAYYAPSTTPCSGGLATPAPSPSP